MSDEERDEKSFSTLDDLISKEESGRFLPEAVPEFPIRVGILTGNFSNGLVRPDVPNAFEDIFIDRRNLNGAPLGMKVVCEVIEAPADYEIRGRQYDHDPLTGRGMAKGRIIEVLGEVGATDVTIQGIMIMHGLKADFPQRVIAKAKQLPTDLSDQDMEKAIQNGRIDRRQECIITIDGEDAKDLDDAVSITRTADRHILLGVHIADVTAYVTEGDVIDKEAALRGTSVYLVDRVIPMLPQVLSNGSCSLNPGKPKLAISVLMKMNDSGEIISSEITESIIESKERFTYDEVYRMIGSDRETISRLEEFRPMLELMYETTVKMRKNRFLKGSINFEFPETKVSLDIDKNVLDVYAAPATFANEMIEECMIACNEQIARRFALLKAPFIYRVHEQPDGEKIERFQKVAKLFGEKIHFSDTPKPEEIHQVIQQIADKPYGSTLMQLLLRSMAKARYANRCLGHFGLSLTYYCHFTSPIRRYPDLFIHRVVKAFLHNKEFPKKWIRESAQFSDSNSESERGAMQAERESVDFKTAEYMERHIGDIFEGKVTGMFHAGVFVQLANTIEGMVPFRTLGSYYEYDEDQMVARSSTGNFTIRIGDPVTVKVFHADRIARRIEFSLDESTLKQEKNPARQRKTQQNSKFGASRNGSGSRGKGSSKRSAGSGSTAKGKKQKKKKGSK